MKYICPVCGYPDLVDEPYDQDNNPSYSICSCCGYEFGFDDQSNKISFEEYRIKWIQEGTKWFLPELKPAEWDIYKQLKNLQKLK